VHLEDSETLSRLKVLLALGLALGLGSRVEVWALSDTNAALTGAEAEVVIVVGCGVVGGAVVPNSKIVLTVPLESALQVMVLSDHTEELIEEMIGFTLGETIDMLYMMANSEDSLPSGNRVGADDWVLSGELLADVEWVATSLRVELESLVTSGLSEERLGVGGGKTIEELLVGRGETIVNFVAGCPKSITAKGWKISELQDSIIGWNRLKGDVRVPTFLE